MKVLSIRNSLLLISFYQIAQAAPTVVKHALPSAPVPAPMSVPTPTSAPIETSSSTPTEAKAPSASPFLTMRDPFKMPEIPLDQIVHKTELETYPLESLKLVGVLTGPDRIKAMLQTADGKSYFVTEKMKLGLRGGVIFKITPEKIQVREKMSNILGQIETVDSEILLPSDSKGPKQEIRQ